ncbi:MAG TPA: DEAD/DEAH box helicase [Steroidobacteraceae bacterium]|nr:DEAD/DEAH box helicase [Steroidobacteraceae bacterium]
MSALQGFHPAVAAWFRGRFAAPTAAQEQAWPAIQAGRNVLVAAPTGSGKTLSAFLAALDELVREGQAGALPDETRIVYVSPLKALSNDIESNLAAPLAGIRAELARLGCGDVEIRIMVRTGDTPQTERARMRRQAPHIVVTTPESLYILLGSKSGRQMLGTTRTVIVDEIHALAGNKRGAHLALSLERLAALAGRLNRIGLSATQTPIGSVARFLTGTPQPGAGEECVIIDAGHARARDLQLEVTGVPLEAVMSGDAWTLVYDRLAALAAEHRTTLIFVNTRKLTERLARQLSLRLGAEHVMAHHGSMARDKRHLAEQRLRAGELKVLVATASLELGIDIGDVDLVCQIASPRSINAFLQRVGRSGHAVGGTSKGRLFPVSRDDLVECTALLLAVRAGLLDVLHVPDGTLDVLAQQIAAEVACRECGEEELFALIRRALPFATLTRAQFDAVVRMLGEGFSTRRGRRGALIHHDAVNHKLRARRGTRLTALTNGGAIPDTADYKVILEPEALPVGSVNEDFAVESNIGDIFQLGNASYRVLRVERGTLRVEDAKGQPPTIPFWLGEAPGRTWELSVAVSGLREAIAARLGSGAREWLLQRGGIPEAAADQLIEYLAAAHAALGCLPTHDTVVLERFFDEAGGMQLIVHAPFGARINRAWGLALRKRFCRQFNFELQAAATEDALLLSLTTAHSFELQDVAHYLHSNSALQILTQALCAAPMFMTRWRWAAAIALALPRFRNGRKVPPPIARMNAEDLLASVFPDQVACAENLPGEIEVPDHPLVNQTIADCLTEAMDAPGWLGILRRLESGTLAVVSRDLTEPSPLALEVLSARPYAFLDDAPLEERRTQAVMSRRWLDPQSAADIGRLDPDAIARVREEAWPDARSADELHDGLSWMGYLTAAEVAANPLWPPLLATLRAESRAVQVRSLWVAAERRAQLEAALAGPDQPDHAEALGRMVQSRLDGLGPVTAEVLAATLPGVPLAEVHSALLRLQTQGVVMRGRFSTPTDEEWCERRLLARIHRYTVRTLREQIEPVAARDYMRFLFDWQRVTASTRMQGPDAMLAVLDQLEGIEVAAGAWESDVLPARIKGYEPAWLDEHCLAGRYLWARLSGATRAAADAPEAQRAVAPVRATPICLLARRNLKFWSALGEELPEPRLSSGAAAVAGVLKTHGATFFDELVDATRLLPIQVEEALGELVALGLANSDSYAGLRALLLPADRRRAASARSRRRAALFGMADSGRWSWFRRLSPAPREAVTEQVVRTLLRRWGVVCWQLLRAEPRWLPPWRELVSCLRRLEARGEIRGGRFIAGLSGEQYALPEAVGALRETRRKPVGAQDVSLSAVDPLNLTGILTAGQRLPALSSNRVLYRDGLPLALLIAGEVRFLAELTEAERWQAQNALIRRQSTAAAALDVPSV